MKRLVFLISLQLLFHSSSVAQHRDSIAIRSYDHIRKSTYVPLSLMAAGIIANRNTPESIKNELKEERNEHLGHFHTSIDNYLQFSPIIIAYGLDAFGVKSKTDFANRTAILLKGELMVGGLTALLKNTTHQLRPDNSTYNSFPSGHTAQAFAAATFLSEEYKDRIRWMPYAAYSLATGVGMMRMANNRHYISDVLVGAGLGILSMKVSYWTHKYKWGHKEKHIQTL
jgi:membrane-associated phospholipid phosphatase